MKDLLIVGAGLTGCTLAAELSRGHDVTVIDCRPHPGGLCADFATGGGHAHLHGPHVFHEPEGAGVADWLSRWTDWEPFEYTVTAEVELDGRFEGEHRHSRDVRQVPFPVSEMTENLLGRKLSDADVRDLFYREYSQKVWGRSWEALPQEITERVPPRGGTYFPGHVQLKPRDGWSAMFRRMLGGVDAVLGAEPDCWRALQPRHRLTVHCGRADQVCVDGRLQPPEYRTLRVEWLDRPWDHGTTALHCCHFWQQWTRMVSWAAWGAPSWLVSCETPTFAGPFDTSPLYVLPDAANKARHAACLEKVARVYGGRVRMAGRLGAYRYLDIWQAVAEARRLAEEIRCSLG